MFRSLLLYNAFMIEVYRTFSDMTFLKKHKNDILLIAAVLVIAGGVWLYTFLTRTQGGEAVVSIDGEEVMRLPLDVDSVTELGEGEHTNLLVISGGAASVTEASCPDHLCVRQGEARYDGETIVCLPNKLVVTITGGGEPEVDAAVGGKK